MEDGRRDDELFERLSPEGKEVAPVGYRHMTRRPTRAAVLRMAESLPYRAAGYVCGSFRKPISKCCGPDDEQP
jgi:hypothetical protein